MKTASTCAAAPFSVPEEIRRFLDGESDGHEVLSLLYGTIEGESVPERFRVLIRRHCPRLVVG